MNPNQKVSFEALFPIIKEELDRGESFAFTAFGNSMYPTIQGGIHRVTLSPIKDELKKGDILFYRRKNGVFVLHRLCKIEADGTLTFCGDNQYVLEKNVQRSQIIAILTKLEKNNKDVTSSSSAHSLFIKFLPLRRFYLHVIVYLKRKIKAFFT